MTRRVKRFRSGLLPALLIGLLILATGCSLTLVSPAPGNEGDELVVEPTPTTEDEELRLYFPDVQAEYMLVEERLVAVGSGTLAEAAVRELVNGPELPYLGPALAPATELLSLDIEDGIAYVNLNEDAKVGGSAQERAAIRSLVLTLTELDGIEQVQILIDGRSNVSLGGHFMLSEPMSRADVFDANTVPEIVAESEQIKLFWPRPGTSATGSIELWGIAQVYEAHLEYELVQNGITIAEGFTTARTADWGSFFETVILPDDAGGDALLRIYSPSAEDGSRMFMIELPLTLEAPEVVAESQQIKVYAPAPGSTVGSEFEIWGVAQVYEGTVSYDLTVDGEVVVEGFTTAWDWDWGTFRESVTVPSGTQGEGMLRLYSVSAEDGSLMFVVEIPVIIEGF